MARKYTFNFIALGSEHKTYLRYYCQNETLNIPLDLELSKEQLQQLNDGTLGGMIQKVCYQTKNKYVTLVETLNLKNNHYPMPAEIREYLAVTEKALEVNYLIRQYLSTVHKKPNTKRIYSYALARFEQYCSMNMQSASIKTLVNKRTIDDYERFLYGNAKARKKTIAPISVHNYQQIVKKFLNFVAEKYSLPEVDYTLHVPDMSSKWHIPKEDFNRLLQHKPTTTKQRECLEILKVNQHIGMRIGDFLKIDKDNITFDDDVAYINFREGKKGVQRTVVIIDRTAIDILKSYSGWSIDNRNTFNYVLQSIAKKVFEDETVKIYKSNSTTDDFVEVKKSDAISSHAIRRYAIARNIVTYGIDVARSLSGHTDYQVITRHYAQFINKEDLKNKLLKKK